MPDGHLAAGSKPTEKVSKVQNFAKSGNKTERVNLHLHRGMMAKEAAKKTKRPTAQKRDLQHEKRRLENRIYKSRVRTAIRAVREAVAKGDQSLAQHKLDDAYSILDKCAKRGVFKRNKVSRTKSRLAAHAVAKV